MKKLSISIVGMLVAVSCSGQDNTSTTSIYKEESSKKEHTISSIVDGKHRKNEEKDRDEFRNPTETLEFFGVQNDMTVVEIWPGGGWYTNIIAPYLATGDGVYYAASFDPNSSDRARQAIQRFQDKFQSNDELYGDVRLTSLSNSVAPQGGADMVLTFRNVHNWMQNGKAKDNFNKFFVALKPGGVLGVVEHRASEDAVGADGTNGYVKESTVQAYAEAAGFVFEEASEINANPQDTKDHPYGVWTLPPVRRSSEVRGVVDPGFDRGKYDLIGESDRMTLKFRKPLSADGALLE